jgi:hypothetical protein
VAITCCQIIIVINKSSVFEDSSVVAEAEIKNQVGIALGITTTTMTEMSAEDLTMTLHVATTTEPVCGHNVYRIQILLIIRDTLTLTILVAVMQDVVILVAAMPAVTIGPGRLPLILKMVLVIHLATS